jgi:hypothetical protein
MEDVKFDSVRQVEDLYESLIDIYNDVQMEYEMLEATDDDIQELRNTTLDKYDYSLMAEVYSSLGETETFKELEEKANDCQEVIEDLQKKLEGVDIKEHLFKFYEMEIRKENFDIQMKACEKYLEKSQRRREIEKLKGTIRPASPRRFPNLTRVPSPRFISDSSDDDDDEDDSSVSSSSEESTHSPVKAPKETTVSQIEVPKAKPAVKKNGPKLNLLPVAPAPVPEEVKQEPKTKAKPKAKSEPKEPEVKVEVSLPPPPPVPAKGGKGKKK